MLGDLRDPRKYTEPVSITGRDSKQLIAQLRVMHVIRAAEEKIADHVVAKDIVCPCHLGIGQEAVAVGVASQLRKTDRTFGAHRSHTHYLSQGGSLYGLFAEVLGKLEGCSRGMGGSMHLYDGPNGFYGSVPIVAGTISLAVGAALAAFKDKKGDVGVSYFGDGAAEEGTLHESLNFAEVYKLPVLFVCENNLFSSHLHIDLRQPAEAVSRYAVAHRMPHELVDGNDIVAVAKAAEKLLKRSRAGEGPGFLEAVTYRWRGHVGPSEDIDVGVARNTDLTAWKGRDPIRRLADALVASGALTKSAYDELKAGVSAEIDREWKRAEEAPYPGPEATLDLVYSRKGRVSR